jgi:hypothetical protein
MKVDTQETILTLNKATKAFKAEMHTADDILGHALTCKLCRSKVRSFFYTCHTLDSLVFKHVVAHVDAEGYRAGLKNIRQEIEIAESPDAAPAIEWLDGLYSLSDDRAR